MKLRKLEQKDIPLIYEWMKDPRVNCFFRFDPDAVTMETVKNFVCTAQDMKTNMHLACVDDCDEYLGTISLKHIDPTDKTAEYAVSFRYSAHGTGAARFATQEILRIAFEKLDLEKVYLNVLEENVHACRFYEKQGFVYEGTARSHIRIGKTRHDLKWYGILKENWLCRS